MDLYAHVFRTVQPKREKYVIFSLVVFNPAAIKYNYVCRKVRKLCRAKHLPYFDWLFFSGLWFRFLFLRLLWKCFFTRAFFFHRRHLFFFRKYTYSISLISQTLCRLNQSSDRTGSADEQPEREKQAMLSLRLSVRLGRRQVFRARWSGWSRCRFTAATPTPSPLRPSKKLEFVQISWIILLKAGGPGGSRPDPWTPRPLPLSVCLSRCPSVRVLLFISPSVCVGWVRPR